jgi:8-oxo-dGTP pyrophosphatase MutT (NUDIX family)
LETNNRTELQSLIQAMQDTNINAGIILNDVSQTMERIKNEFTIIQASGGLVYSNEKKILLIFRRGKWDLPKGKLDDGEDLIECALREVREETGLSQLIYNEFLCTSYHTYYENNKHILKESHWHLLRGNEKEALVPQTDEDIEKCKWVTEEELGPYLDNAPASIIDVVNAGLQSLKQNKFSL